MRVITRQGLRVWGCGVLLVVSAGATSFWLTLVLNRLGSLTGVRDSRVSAS